MSLEKFQGALLGTFIGDALGMPVEGMTHETIFAKFGGPLKAMVEGRLPKGSYTDDTQMMIGLAQALAEKGKVDGAMIGSRFVDNFEARRGYGPATVKIIEQLRKGARWDAPAKKVYDGLGSFGNGAPMRIAPLGCLFYDDISRLREAAESCSSITHTHPLGMEGGVIQALAVALAVGTDPHNGLDPMKFITNLIKFSNKAEFIKPLKTVKGLLERKEAPEVYEVVKALGNDVKAYTSCPAAIYCFLSHWGSFEDTVVYAVNLGGDTDTIGAMAGAISGGFHGIKAIPKRWLDDLDNLDKGRDFVLELAEKLWERKGLGP